MRNIKDNIKTIGDLETKNITANKIVVNDAITDDKQATTKKYVNDEINTTKQAITQETDTKLATKADKTTVNSLTNTVNTNTANTTTNATNIANLDKTKVSKSDLFNLVYPIGSIYISVNSANPGTIFGGTWQAYAEGRTLIGVGKSDIGFAIGATGGESEHTLTQSEIPSHNHDVTIDTAILRGEADQDRCGFYGGTTDASGVFSYSEGSRVASSWDNGQRTNKLNFNGDHKHYASCDNTGDGHAHNNLPPYVVVYMWQRVS